MGVITRNKLEMQMPDPKSFKRYVQSLETSWEVLSFTFAFTSIINDVWTLCCGSMSHKRSYRTNHIKENWNMDQTAQFILGV